MRCTTIRSDSHATATDRFDGGAPGRPASRADPSLAGLAERIAVAAVGNPFFVEEIVRDLAGRGVLVGESWVATA